MPNNQLLSITNSDNRAPANPNCFPFRVRVTGVLLYVKTRFGLTSPPSQPTDVGSPALESRFESNLIWLQELISSSQLVIIYSNSTLIK